MQRLLGMMGRCIMRAILMLWRTSSITLVELERRDYCDGKLPMNLEFDANEARREHYEAWVLYVLVHQGGIRLCDSFSDGKLTMIGFMYSLCDS